MLDKFGKGFAALLISAICARAAAGLYGMSLKLVAKHLSDAPTAVAGLSVALGIPALVLPIFTGAIADRFDRRKTLRAVHLFRLAVGLAIVAGLSAGELDLVFLYSMAFLLGASALLWAAVGPALVGKVVPGPQMTRAFGLMEATTAAAITVAPSIGGLLASVWLGAPFALAALLLAVSALALTFLPGDFRVPPRPGRSFGRAMFEIIPRMKRYPTVVGFGAAFALAVFADTATDSILVLHVVRPGPVGLDEKGFGLVLAGAALGQISGGLLASRVERALGMWKGSALALLAAGPCFALLMVSPSPVLVISALSSAYFTHAIIRVMSMSAIQQLVREEERGRVMAMIQFFTYGFEPLGGLVGGLVGQQFGLTAVFGTSAGVALAAFVAYVAIVPRQREPMPPPAAAA